MIFSFLLPVAKLKCYNYNHKCAITLLIMAESLNLSDFLLCCLICTLLNWDWGLGLWVLSQRMLGKICNLGIMSDVNARGGVQSRVKMQNFHLYELVKEMNQRFRTKGVWEMRGVSEIMFIKRFRESRKKPGSERISWAWIQILGMLCIHGNTGVIRKSVLFCFFFK